MPSPSSEKMEDMGNTTPIENSKAHHDNTFRIGRHGTPSNMTPRSYDLYERSRNLDMLMARVKGLSGNSSSLMSPPEKKISFESNLNSSSPRSTSLSKVRQDSYRFSKSGSGNSVSEYSHHVLRGSLTQKNHTGSPIQVRNEVDIANSPVQRYGIRWNQNSGVSSPFLSPSPSPSMKLLSRLQSPGTLTSNKVNLDGNGSKCEKDALRDSQDNNENCVEESNIVIKNRELIEELKTVRTELAIAKGYRVTNNELNKRLEAAHRYASNLEVKIQEKDEEFDARLKEKERVLRKEESQRLQSLEETLASKTADVIRLESRLKEQKESDGEEQRVKPQSVIANKVATEVSEKKESIQTILKSQLQEAVDTSSVYKKELDNLTVLLKKYEGEKRVLEKQLRHKEKEIEISGSKQSLQTILDKVTSERDQFRQEVQTMSETMKSLNLVIKEKDRDVLDLKTQLQNANSAEVEALTLQQSLYSQIQERTNQQEIADNSIRKQITEKDQKINQMENNIREAIESYDNAAQKVELLEQENCALSAQLEEQKASNKSFGIMLEEYERVASQCQMEANQANEKIRDLEEQLAMRLGEIAVLKEAHHKMKGSF